MTTTGDKTSGRSGNRTRNAPSGGTPVCTGDSGDIPSATNLHASDTTINGVQQHQYG